jgi:hypothetical protein
MNTLSELYVSVIEEEQAAAQQRAADQQEALAAKQQEAELLLEDYLENWPPLRSCLGLRGASQKNERVVGLTGQTSINNLPVATSASVEVPLYNGYENRLTLTIRSQTLPDVVNTLAIPIYVNAVDYPRKLGVLCSTWMENFMRAKAEAETVERTKAEALANARKLIDLAKIYMERQERYKEECRVWATAQAALLWEPHVLWRVRYVPIVGMGERDEENVDTVVCMEEPADILNALKQFPTATVTSVDVYGHVTETEIPSFLDARIERYTRPTCAEAMPYHRQYWACPDVVLNVPAHVISEPEPPPPFPAWHRFLTECDSALSDYTDEDPNQLVGITPEQMAQRYLRVWMS